MRLPENRFHPIGDSLQFFVRDITNHNVSHAVIFLFAIVAVFRQTFRKRKKVVNRFTSNIVNGLNPGVSVVRIV